jgi:hypothetical protein
MGDRVAVRHGTRGMYVLYKFRPKLNKYDVLYVGMAAKENASVRSRLDRASSLNHLSITAGSVEASFTP